MGERTFEKLSRWLLPIVLILFILQIITLPYVLGVTYSGRSEDPNHILTYTRAKLTWDDATGIDENGTAEMSLFKASYENVTAGNSDSLIAPGTEGFNIIRLKNMYGGSVEYKAVLYQIKTNEKLPVSVTLQGENYTDAEEYVLPEGVTKEQVIRAVEGSLRYNEIEDFDVVWKWDYYTDDMQDQIDTMLGNKEDDITVGLYIVVVDNNPDWSYEEKPQEPNEENPQDSNEENPENRPEDENNKGESEEEYQEETIITPTAPKTNDNSHVSLYFGLMTISFILLIILLFEQRKGNKQE